MASSNLDIIEFVRPHAKENNLYVTNISNRLTESTVIAKLYQIFSQFGLLYEVQVLGCGAQPLTSGGHDLTAPSSSSATASRGGLYAFVKFYSAKDTHTALCAINGKYMLEGRLLKVRLASRQKPIENRAQLGFQQCCELANHYLGFNGWTSQIVTLDEDSIEPDVARFVAVVKIDVRHHNVCSEGVGVGEVDFTPQEPMSKITACLRAKKIAVQRASEGAFSKLIFVVLPNGKVAVDVNCTGVEERHYVTQEELKDLVQVKQIGEVSTSDEEADIEGALALEANDTGDLDEMNAQVLLDLQLDA